MRFFILIFSTYVIKFSTAENAVTTSSTLPPECDYKLSLTSDGPVTLDVPITFYAKLNCYTMKNKYMFVFEDHAEPKHKAEVSGNHSVSQTFIYPEKTYESGDYVMTVSAFSGYFEKSFTPYFYIKVASNNISFSVSEFIPGNISLFGVIKRDNDDSLYIATGSIVNMTVNIHYPTYIYKQSEMSYSWTIDEDQYITTAPQNIYKFAKTGTFTIHVTAVARIPIFIAKNEEIKYKWGHYYQKVIVKDPFNSINLTGNNYLQHGQLFNLEVSCNGSGPFEYCWKIFQPQDNVSNLVCSSPVVTNQCSFPIIYYFHESGKYKVIIKVDNSVSSLERDVEVIVYDVSQRPQLSTVIIPLTCSILVLFIIAAGVMLHLRHNQNLDIETADFDFLQAEPSDLETSWERLYQSVVRFLNVCMFRRDQYYIMEEDQVASLSAYYNSMQR